MANKRNEKKTNKINKSEWPKYLWHAKPFPQGKARVWREPKNRGTVLIRPE